MQVSTSTGLYSVALVGLVAALFDRKIRRQGLFLLLFTAFSFLGVCPGLHFRLHYFLLLAPAISLLAGVGSITLGQLLRRVTIPERLAVLVALLALGIDVSKQRAYLFVLSPLEIVRLYSFRFSDAKRLGVYVGSHSLPEDRIAVLGSQPEIYFYARRQAATKFIYFYPLFEPQPYSLRMQEDMIAEMEQARPRFIVLVRAKDSWYSFLDPNAPSLISRWPSEYVAKQYRRVAVADMLPQEPTQYHFDKDAVSYSPISEDFIVVYERVDSP